MTYRRGYTTDRAQPPVRRGVAGLKGVAVVAGDLTRVFPRDPVSVPSGLETPLTGGDRDVIPVGAGDPASQTVYVQPDDPGAVGAGKLWVDDTTVEPVTVRVRNAADDGWRDLLESYEGSGTLLISGVPDAPVFGGELQLSPAADPDGGDAFLSGGNSEEFGGAAQIKGGNATDRQGALIKAFGGDDQGGGAVGGGVELTAGSGPGGNGASILMAGAGAANGSIEVIAKEIEFSLDDPPEVPASPTEQDIVDALLALGLVTQAAP